MRNYAPEPRLYEMLTILSPDVAEEDIPGQLDAIAGYVTTAGGSVDEVLRDSPWGRRRLAYTIRHAGRDIRDGYYTVFHMTLDPGGVRDIERDLKLNDQVIRFLITHYTPKPVQPGQQPEGAAPAQSTAGAAPAVDAAAPAESAVAEPAGGDAPAATAGAAPAIADPVAVEPDVAGSDAVADASVEVESTFGAPEPTDPALPGLAGDLPADGAATDPVTSEDAGATGTVDNAAAMDASTGLAPVAESTQDGAGVASDTPETTVEADAAPAEPIAPAKDTEEA